MAKIKAKDWSRKSADVRAEMEAAAQAEKPKPVVHQISEARLAEIRADAHSGTNWASKLDPGSACACGAGERTQLAAVAFKGAFGVPTGSCYRHPGGTVHRNPQGTTHPGENGH